MNEHGENEHSENDRDGSRVAVAGSADLELVVRALTESFFADPVMMWAFADEVRMSRLSGMWQLLAEHGYIPEGTSTVLPSGDGAALWTPPGKQVGEAFWGQHGLTFVESLEGDLERIGALGAAMGEHHPSEAHWYLLAIGVRPETQGRGLGGVLLAHTLAQVDERREAAYLEATSPRSRQLYARFGFEVMSEFSAPGGPPVWGMWREPK
jgi:GNAT superfamily N-acetyltransferase